VVTAIKLVRNGMTYESMLAETVAFRGHKGDVGEAYYARPLGGGPWPGIVLIHHMPGWDEWIKEATRKLAHHGLATIAPHLYFREGPGSPDDVGARVRAAGGVTDEQVLGDVAGSMEFLRAQPYANGKIGVIGFCSGGRPIAPIDLTAKLRCPLLGLFGNDDENPNRDQVNRTEAVLKKLGKTYEFHRYDGAGHAFFNAARPAYRPEQALDGWNKVFAFFRKHLATAAAARAA
jgi:carboxymethylenebutenolidase